MIELILLFPPSCILIHVTSPVVLTTKKTLGNIRSLIGLINCYSYHKSQRLLNNDYASTLLQHSIDYKSKNVSLSK